MTDRLIAMYRNIGVFPIFTRIKRHSDLAPSAPLCEEDDGSVAFMSQEEKDRWIRFICTYDGQQIWRSKQWKASMQ